MVEPYQANPTGRRPWSRLTAHWTNYILHFTWQHLGMPQLESLAGHGEALGDLLSLLPPGQEEGK